MPILITNGARNINAANGFYVIDAYNLGTVSSTTLDLSTSKAIALTFSTTSTNVLGVVLCLAANSHCTKAVTVSIQNAAHVELGTVTLTAASISNSIANNTSDGWFVPFTFDSAVLYSGTPTHLDVSEGAGTGDWRLRTSNGTAAFHAVWGDTAASFSDNDTVVAKDILTINATSTIHGTLGTGVTTEAQALIICKSTTVNNTGYGNLQWNPVASYTMTIDGCIMMGAHSGIYIGTDLVPIPFAQQAIISFINPTVGTQSGIHYASTATGYHRKASMWLYGSYPTTMWARLYEAALASQAVIKVIGDVTTAWAAGDNVSAGGVTAKNSNDSTARTILGGGSAMAYDAGNNYTTITLSSNLSQARSINRPVVNVSHFGIKLLGNSTTVPVWYLSGLSNFVMRGVYFDIIPSATYFGISGNTATSYSLEASSIRSKYSITYCSFSNVTNVAYRGFLTYMFSIPPEGFDIKYNTFTHRGAIWSGPYCYVMSLGEAKSGILTVSNNVYCPNESSTNVRHTFTINGPPPQIVYSNNILDGAGSINLYGKDLVVNSNEIWNPNPSAYAGLHLEMVLSGSGSGNSFDNATIGLVLGSFASNFKFTNNTYGATVANTQNFNFVSGACIFNYEDTSCTGLISGAYTAGNENALVTNSKLRITEENNADKADTLVVPYGIITRTNSLLGDTTVRTAGAAACAMRFCPTATNGTDEMVWSFTVPTGDITNKTMNVNVWVKHNHANYYAGTHTHPTLRVNYDNGTELTAVAVDGTDWQRLSVTFTPATAYGQITVSIEGATDATGTERNFYVDDFTINYPAGVALALGGIDLWANAEPVTPTIDLFPSLGGVWDEALSAHTAAGSFGAWVKKLLSVAKFFGLKD